MLGDSLRRRHGAPPEPKPERPARSSGSAGRRFRLGPWLLAAVVVLLGSFGVGYLLSTQVLFPKPETAGTGLAVPDLAGAEAAEAERRLAEAGLAVGEVVALANPEADSGRVLAQDPLPGQQLRRGGAVDFAVSAGAPRVRIPALAGLRVTVARALLEGAGLGAEEEPVDSLLAPAGVVVDADPAPGSMVRLPATVVLRVSTGPPPDSAAAAADSAAAARLSTERPGAVLPGDSAPAAGAGGAPDAPGAPGSGRPGSEAPDTSATG